MKKKLRRVASLLVLSAAFFAFAGGASCSPVPGVLPSETFRSLQLWAPNSWSGQWFQIIDKRAGTEAVCVEVTVASPTSVGFLKIELQDGGYIQSIRGTHYFALNQGGTQKGCFTELSTDSQGHGDYRAIYTVINGTVGRVSDVSVRFYQLT